MTASESARLGTRLGGAQVTGEILAVALECARDVPAVARAVAIAGSDLLGADRGCLFAADRAGDWQLVVASGFLYDGIAPYLTIPRGSALPIAVAASFPEPMLFADNAAFARRWPELGPERARHGLEAEAIIAARQGSRALGVAAFDWHAPHDFTADDVTVLTAIVTHAAAALSRLEIP